MSRVPIDSPWLTSREAAAYARVSRTTLFAAVRDKKLTAHKPAKAYLFSSAELDRWVRAEGARRRKAS